MTYCSCGNVAEENGGQCSQCAALKLFELKRGASKEEIESAFRVLAKVWQPERFENDAEMRVLAEKKVKALTSAYSHLMKQEPEASLSKPANDAATAAQAEVPQKSKRRKRDWRAGIRWRGGLSKRVFIPPASLMLGCGVILSAIMMACIFFKPLDAMLMSNSATSQVYSEYKAAIHSKCQEIKNRIRNEAPSPFSRSSPRPPAAVPPPAQPAEEPTPASGGPMRHVAAAKPGQVRRMLPLITAGLSKSEVISVAGNPTAATGNTLVYGKSEIYFQNDSVVGWKIDPASGIRVKLWPDAMVDPNLNSFGVGSSKNDVIAVQGTPTLFSESTFGYGASQVYFHNDRVVSWKSDPSAPLRTLTR